MTSDWLVPVDRVPDSDLADRGSVSVDEITYCPKPQRVAASDDDRKFKVRMSTQRCAIREPGQPARIRAVQVPHRGDWEVAFVMELLVVGFGSVGDAVGPREESVRTLPQSQCHASNDA